MRARLIYLVAGLVVGSVCGAGAVFGILAGGTPAVAPAPLTLASPNPLDTAFVELAPTEQQLAGWRTLGPVDDPDYLDTVLAEAFAETPPDDPESKALRLASYVAQTTQNKFTATPSGTVVLQQGFGFCNGMALAFVSLCRRAGLPARVNALQNIEWMEAHNMAEVYYDNAWHCFDPTYGTFFHTGADYPGMGRIVSLGELMAAPGQFHCFQLPEKLWTGEYHAGATVRPLSPEARYGSWKFSLAEFYDHIFHVASPVVYDVAQAVSYPIDLDLREETVVWKGQPNGDLMDLFGKKDGRYPRFHGVPFLGPTRLGDAYHVITLRTPGPGACRITYHLGPNSQAGDIAPVELKNVVVGARGVSGQTWHVDVQTQGKEALLLLVNRGGTAYIDAIQAERLDAPAQP